MKSWTWNEARFEHDTVMQAAGWLNLRWANLLRANLLRANLSWANLSWANLSEADLSEANLRGANLSEADLSEANLSGANLSEADLRCANLRGASLSEADLSEANLSWANLSEADLSEADLSEANLRGANLRGTVLDLSNKPNANTDGFEQTDGFILGYRTRKAGHIDQYCDGRYYSADWFSTCEQTECHPGLYLWPTLQRAKEWSDGEIIRVRTKPECVHRAGDKWRCQWFEVIGTANALKGEEA